MSTPKVGLFGIPLKMGSKIRKISKFQTDVEITLVDGFRWNLYQMKGLGLIFQDFFDFWKNIHFWMCCTYLNITQIRIFGFSQNYRKYKVFERISRYFGKYFFQTIFLKLFYDCVSLKWSCQIVYNYSRSKVTAENVNQNFKFSDFCLIP